MEHISKIMEKIFDDRKKFKESPEVEVGYIKTGSLSFDLLINSKYGIPVGKLSEMHGRPPNA